MSDLREEPQTRFKDPDAKETFGFRWHKWLDADEAETITDSTWSAESGITISVSPGPSINAEGNRTTCWLEGGTAGESYLVTNTVTTSLGRIDERTMRIKVLER